MIAVTLAFVLLAAGPVLAQGDGAGLGTLPALFTGDLPCADCPGLRYRVELYPDGEYVREVTYLDRDLVVEDLGRWLTSAGRLTLLDASGTGDGEHFAVVTPDRLDRLDLQGRPIESDLNYSLARQPPDGVVAAEFENTYWRLTRIGGEPVAAAAGQREAHLVFAGPGASLRGFGGCNRIQGSYRRGGDDLEIGQLVTTQMFCADGSETEQAFLTALDRVDGWRVVGQRLELLAGDEPLLRFAAIHLR